MTEADQATHELGHALAALTLADAGARVSVWRFESGELGVSSDAPELFEFGPLLGWVAAGPMVNVCLDLRRARCTWDEFRDVARRCSSTDWALIERCVDQLDRSDARLALDVAGDCAHLALSLRHRAPVGFAAWASLLARLRADGPPLLLTLEQMRQVFQLREPMMRRAA